MQFYKNNLILLILSQTLFQGQAFAQCGNCRPNKFSLIYSYLVPGQIKRFTNPVFRANQVVNTVRNPSLLLSPCNPITNTAANLINKNVSGALNTNNSNGYTASYIPNPTTNENAYVSGFSENKETTENTNNSYFDENTNSYVWVLPEDSQQSSIDTP